MIWQVVSEWPPHVTANASVRVTDAEGREGVAAVSWLSSRPVLLGPVWDSHDHGRRCLDKSPDFV